MTMTARKTWHAKMRGIAMFEEFYYGSAWHWPLKYVPRVMLSFNFVRTLKKAWDIDIPFMLDSGAYSVVLKYGRYLWEPKDYLDSIEKWQPDVAWTMDYPCEPSARKMGGYDVLAAQEMTNENTRKMIDYGVSSVVQGWEIRDYLINLDKIKDDGLMTERLGIGSVCRRGQTDQIVNIIRAIHRNVPRWVKLHGFGIKTSILKTEARYLLYSADSTAWAYTWGRWSDKHITMERKVNRLNDYISLIEPRLLTTQETLPIAEEQILENEVNKWI